MIAFQLPPSGSVRKCVGKWVFDVAALVVGAVVVVVVAIAIIIVIAIGVAQACAGHSARRVLRVGPFQGRG